MSPAQDWLPCRLDDLGFVGRGKSRHRPRNDERLYGGPYQFIQTADIMSADPYIVRGTQTYSEFGLSQSKLWTDETLCITIAGANTARTAILKVPACFPDSIVGFIPHRGISDIYFVKYALDQLRDRFLAISRGATQDNLSLDKLLSFSILSPSFELQRRIGGILKSYDDLIDVNQRRIAILEEMARRLFDEWFVQFRYPGHEVGALAGTELGEIPKGWNINSIADFVDTQYGYTASSSVIDTGPRFLRGMDINKRSYIDWSEVPSCDKLPDDLKKYKLWRDDILIIRMADPGKIAIVESDVDAIFASYLVRIRADYRVLTPYFLFYMLSADKYQNHILGAANGATRKSIPAPLMISFRFALPPRTVLAEFESLVGPWRGLIAKLVEANTRLRAARDLLLPKLISGEIDVGRAEAAWPEAAE